MAKISAVIVTWNEEKNITRAFKSIKPYVDEVIVVDMGTDDTSKIAQKLGAQVYKHKYTGFVEPARNFAIKKATGDWVFILDADEEIPHSLGNQLKHLSQGEYSYYEIARKNIIFNKWVTHTRFWPDYLVRFFKRDSLSWPDQIHVQPNPDGIGKKLTADEEHAIMHHHYQSISQFVERVNRYTDHQLKILEAKNYKFSWPDLIKKPTSEFLSRFYAGEGYKDGLHGLSISLLQACSELVLYLKAWEKEKFRSVDSTKFRQEVESRIATSYKDFLYWKNFNRGILSKLKSKIKG